MEKHRRQVNEGRQCLTGQDLIHLDRCAERAVCKLTAQALGTFINLLLAGNDQLTVFDGFLDAVVFMAVQVFDLLDLLFDLLEVLQLFPAQLFTQKLRLLRAL